MANNASGLETFIGEDLTGKKFGRLTVTKFGGAIRLKNGSRMKTWLCKCECGNSKRISGIHLKKGLIVTCGKHPTALTHGMHKHPAYTAYHAAKDRCTNSSSCVFHFYGARGIKFLFPSFSEFWNELGGTWKRGLTLDRIDTNGNYESGNCRWATRKEQSNNTRRNKFHSFNGESLTLAQWADKTPWIAYGTLVSRVLGGKWPIARALTTPVAHKRNRIA